MPGTTKRILLISNDLPPTPGAPVSGGGLRVKGLMKGLEGKGHDVILSVPSVKLEGLSTRAAGRFRETAFRHDRLSRVIHSVDPDIVVVEQWALANFLEEIDVPLVIDLHGSLIMENRFRRHRNFLQNATAKVKALSKADLITCAGEVQRRYFMSWLILSGFQPEELAIESIPNLLGPSADPPRELTRSRTWLFGGAAWPWVNPFPALAIAAEQLRGRPGHRFKLFYGSPENRKVLPHDTTELPDPHLERYQDLVGDNVIASPLISHARFVNECRRAYVALDVFQRNAERELAFITRTSEYLWAGLPVIHAHYDELGTWIQEYSAGWVVDPDDEASLRAVIEEVIENPEEVERRASNARRLADDRLTWERGIEPLHQFCVDPWIRAKSPPFFKRLSLEVARLEEEHDREAEEHEHTIQARDDAVATLKNEIEGRDRTIYDLNQKIESLSGNAADALRKERSAAEERLRLAKKQRVIAEERVLAAEKRSEQLKEKLRAEVSVRDEHISKLGKELEALREESSAAEQALTEQLNEELRTEVTGRDEHILKLGKELEALREESSAAEQALTEQLNEKLCTEVSVRDERISELGKELEALREESSTTEQALSEQLRSDVSGRDEHIFKLGKELEALREESGTTEQALTERVADLQGKLAAAKERRTALGGEINTLQREVHQAQSALEHGQMELSALQDRALTRLEDRLAFFLQRAGVQVPELISALAKSSRNNVYLQLWERFAKKKVFPGT